MGKRLIKRITPRQRRHRRVRARIVGTAARPRLSVFRSAKHIAAQLIDDATGQTIVAASDRDVGEVEVNKGEQRKVAIARQVGAVLAQRAKEKKIVPVVFDRGGYAYHGRVKAIAEGARDGGLKF